MNYFNLAVAVLLTTCAAPAYAALDCKPRQEAYTQLNDAGYQIVFAGDAENATLVIWVHPTQGWVSTIDTQDGATCLVGNGMDWQLRGVGDPV